MLCAYRNGADADINWIQQRHIGEMFYIDGTSKGPSNLNWVI